MRESEKIQIAAHDLMEMHAEAMFTQDRNMRLLTVNEPWPGETAAPRFFLGRTIEGTVLYRFRYDVPDNLVRQLERMCADEATTSNFRAKPKHFDAYMSLLQSEQFTMGPCYLVPGDITPAMQVVRLTRENRGELLNGGFEWLISEIDYAQPCIALIQGNQAVSICRSVRISSKAHEAGLETLDAFRGKGYAAAVVAGWAMEVRKLQCFPLYSTLSENLSSQRVAGKLALSCYGVNFTIR